MIKLIIEAVFSIALFANAMLFIPQIIRLIKVKKSQGLSLITFLGFNLIQLSAVLYGYINADYLLIFGYTLSLLTCGVVTFLIVYYQYKNKNLSWRKKYKS